jgi:hypothetical protein
MEILQLIPYIFSGITSVSTKVEPLLPIHKCPEQQKFTLIEVVVHDSYSYPYGAYHYSYRYPNNYGGDLICDMV